MKNIRKYWFIIAVLMITLSMIVLQPQTGLTALKFSGRNLLNFLFMLTPIFIFIGLMDIWIAKESMIKIMGEKSGIKGIFVSLALGVTTAVPLYALLPVAGILLKKGSKISNVLLFLCSSASIRIPLLLFEASSLGWRFTAIKLLLNIAAVLAIAFIVDRILSENDKERIYKNADSLI